MAFILDTRLIKEPSKRAAQLKHTIFFIPSAVRKDDSRGIPLNHFLNSFP
jgi:hypothetical protein